MTVQMPNLKHATLSDVGMKRLSNEDAACCDEQMSLFVVCDGLGGRPSGEAASQIISCTLGHLIRRKLRQLKSIDAEVLCGVLKGCATQMSDELYEQAHACPALVGMGATMVAALFDGDTAFLLNAGDSRAYRLRDGQLEQLSHDHSKQAADDAGQTAELSTEQADEQAVRERRYLTQFIGYHKPLKPVASAVALRPGDRLLLCTDGLTDAVDDATIRQQLADGKQPADACRTLVGRANAAGGPDNITLTVIDFQGTHAVDPRSVRRRSPANHPPPAGAAQRFHEALGALEDDLNWLREGAIEAAGPRSVAAFAAVKRRLGQETYRRFLERSPSQNPAHVFHQACTDPASDWRQRYTTHAAALDEPLRQITDGTVRLSPILSADETSRIIRTIWRELRRVEQHYFATCQRDAVHASEQTLSILIDHMTQGIRTLQGLMMFFPRFMRRG